MTEPVEYNHQKWLNKMPNDDFIVALNSFYNNHLPIERQIITREQVLEVSQTINNNSVPEAIRKFILIVLVWGYGKNDHWRHVEKIMETPDEDLIRIFNSVFSYFIVANENCIELAFDKFKEMRNGHKVVRGLSTSFISKYLYFIGKCRMEKNYPLIYDSRVNKSLLRLSMNPNGWAAINNNLDYSETGGLGPYINYIELIHNVADSTNVDADKYEYFLFARNGEFDDGELH